MTTRYMEMGTHAYSGEPYKQRRNYLQALVERTTAPAPANPAQPNATWGGAELLHTWMNRDVDPAAVAALSQLAMAEDHPHHADWDFHTRYLPPQGS